MLMLMQEPVASRGTAKQVLASLPGILLFIALCAHCGSGASGPPSFEQCCPGKENLEYVPRCDLCPNVSCGSYEGAENCSEYGCVDGSAFSVEDCGGGSPPPMADSGERPSDAFVADAGVFETSLGGDGYSNTDGTSDAVSDAGVDGGND